MKFYYKKCSAVQKSSVMQRVVVGGVMRTWPPWPFWLKRLLEQNPFQQFRGGLCLPPRRAPGPQTYIGAQSILRQNATGKQMGFRLGRFVITNPGGGSLCLRALPCHPGAYAFRSSARPQMKSATGNWGGSSRDYGLLG